MGNDPRSPLHAGDGLETRPRARRRWLILAALAALAPLIAACGSAMGATGASGHPTLSCTTIVASHGIDVIAAQLTCHVTGAAASDTSFKLQYRVTNPDGNAPRLTSTCDGALHNGSGSCTQTYTAPVPIPLTPGSVSGETSPGHQSLGPVTPVVHDATPVPGQHL